MRTWTVFATLLSTTRHAGQKTVFIRGRDGPYEPASARPWGGARPRWPTTMNGPTSLRPIDDQQLFYIFPAKNSSNTGARASGATLWS